jgi:hypothetical protein
MDSDVSVQALLQGGIAAGSASLGAQTAVSQEQLRDLRAQQRLLNAEYERQHAEEMEAERAAAASQRELHLRASALEAALRCSAGSGAADVLSDAEKFYGFLAAQGAN